MTSERKTVRLGDVASVKGGKRLPKGVNLITDPNDHPYIRVRDLNNKHTLELNTDFEFVDDETQKSIARYIVNFGDIILSIVGTIGLVAIVGESLHNANLTENCVKITQLDGVDRDYLYYFLKSEMGQAEIAKGTVGAVQAKLPIKNIQAIEVILPNIERQKKIASILASIDYKIEVNEKINDNLQQQADAIFSELFLSDVNRSALTVADVSIKVTDGVHNTVLDDPNGDYYLLSCKNIKGGILSISNSERRISKETFEKLRKRTRLEKGDILLSSVGTVGELLLLKEIPSNYEFQRSVAMIKPNPAFVSSEYLYQALRSKKDEIIHAAHGAVQQCLFISDISDFQIPVPTKSELEQFSNLVAPMFSKIHLNECENKRLVALRDALLPKLLSGEIDVSDIQF